MICKKCLLPNTFPGIIYNHAGICNLCDENVIKNNEFEIMDESEIIEILYDIKKVGKRYDVLVPVSGGVDSSFALIKLTKEYKLKPLAVHFDFGYDNRVANENVKKLVDALDIDAIYVSQDRKYMNLLYKYYNESGEKDLSACHVCGNIIYLKCLQIAEKFNIPLVINGYSKGQAEMMYNQERANYLYEKMMSVAFQTGDFEFFSWFEEQWSILKKQIVYKEKADFFRFFEEKDKILFIPLFNFSFYHTDKNLLQKFCRQYFDWEQIEGAYPANTTNCEMILLNSYIDLKRRGYTHYHEEYSTLIRCGEITREKAIEDLDLSTSISKIQELAKRINLNIDIL